MSAGSYGDIATEVYDLDKPTGHSFGDVEFYKERLASCSGRILEPAVGTGRVLIPLLEAGLTVDGFDSSHEMLERCRELCAERDLKPSLFAEKMQTLSVPERYEAIIVPAGSFLLLHERRESLEALKRFREHLVPGGRLILDILFQTDLSTEAVSTRSWTTPEDDFITLESKLVEVDFLKQYTVSHLRYDRWRGGKLVETELQRFPLRWYGTEEFRLVLQSAGFSEVVLSSDYEYGNPPSSAEQTLTFEARRV